MRSITKLDLQYAHRFYGFKGEAQYLHGHTGVLTIEVEDSVNSGVNMVFPCNEIQKTAWEVLKNFDHALILRQDDPLLPPFWMCMRSRASRTVPDQPDEGAGVQD
jgi:6-pyruvoyltetrahydropterin/6-carboxytetrahydropterin synthase